MSRKIKLFLAMLLIDSDKNKKVILMILNYYQNFFRDLYFWDSFEYEL